MVAQHHFRHVLRESKSTRRKEFRDDMVVELVQRHAELQHDAKGTWRGGKRPFQHPCPDRPKPAARKERSPRRDATSVEVPQHEAPVDALNLSFRLMGFGFEQLQVLRLDAERLVEHDPTDGFAVRLRRE